MSLLVFLVVCGAGAVLGLADRQSGRIGRWAGPTSLVAALAAALFIGSTTRVAIGDVNLAGSEYSGRFLACAAGSALLACMVAMASGWPDELAPAALIWCAGLAVATTATDPAVALAAGAVSATAGAIVIVRSTPRGQHLEGRLAEIRTIAIVAAALLLAALVVLRPAWNAGGDSPAIVVTFFCLGIALAVRSGAVPFHVPAARLSSISAPLAPALVLVWIPAGVGLLAISWSATTFGVRSDWLNGAVAVVQAVAVATLVLGALAVLVHDELEEVVAYSIVADAGFVLLAMAARSDASAEPARQWLLVFVAAKTSLVAWAAATSRAFGTSNLGRLRGWLRRTPLLGLALVGIAVATLGWPGSAVYEARSALIRLALPGQLQFIFAVAFVLSVACYVRLLGIGLVSPTEAVGAARSERPRWATGPSRPARTIAGTLEADSGAGGLRGAGEAGAPANASPTGAGPAGIAAVPPAKRRRSRAAVLALPTPAITAAVGGTDEAAGTPGPTEPSGSALVPVSAGAAPGRLRLRHELALTWRLNRTLEVSLVMALAAGIAVALALGRLGAADASQFGIPLDTAAHATPTPIPPPTPAYTATPLPTRAPPATALPSSSGSPGGSVAPSVSP
ncbi:MAG: proton-conducting transporter membrane subunit [Candidatus Limnocylindrales bacterium]|jgi:NADH:ubiquinone oxidoreductase subunit 2 (subunit N)